MLIQDLENWLSNFPEFAKLQFDLDGQLIEWTGGGRRETVFPIARGDLSLVEEVITLEFKHGTGQIP